MDMPTFKGRPVVLVINDHYEASLRDTTSKDEAIEMLESVLSRLKAEKAQTSKIISYA